MSDEPTPPPAQSQPPEPPAPPASPPPAQPPPAAPPQPDVPTLQRDSVIEIPGPDGQPRMTTLGQLADAYVSQPDPELMTELEMYRRAVRENDPAATRELLLKNLPPEPEPASPEQQRLDELQKQVDDMKQVVQSQVNPLMEQLSTHQGLNLMKQVLNTETIQKDYPLAAKYSDAPMLLYGRKRQLEDQVRQAGHNPNNIQMQEQIIRSALTEVEAHVQKVLRDFGATTSTPAPQGPVSVNDQSQASNPNLIPARLRMNEKGEYVRMDGQPAPLPSAPVTPVPSGTMVGPENPTPQGPLTPEKLKEQMAMRTRTLAGTL